MAVAAANVTVSAELFIAAILPSVKQPVDFQVGRQQGAWATPFRHQKWRILAVCRNCVELVHGLQRVNQQAAGGEAFADRCSAGPGISFASLCRIARYAAEQHRQLRGMLLLWFGTDLLSFVLPSFDRVRRLRFSLSRRRFRRREDVECK